MISASPGRAAKADEPDKMCIANCAFHVAAALRNKDLAEMYLSAMEDESNVAKARRYRDFVLFLRNGARWKEGGILVLNKLVLLTSSLSFPKHICHEYLDAAGEDGESQSYGLRIEHVDGDRMAISVERPDSGCGLVSRYFDGEKTA